MARREAGEPSGSAAPSIPANPLTKGSSKSSTRSMPSARLAMPYYKPASRRLARPFCTL